jgi:hypothetical protein
MFVSACIISDIINLRGGNILKTMKGVYILTANAETNITRPLLSNLPLSEALYPAHSGKTKNFVDCRYIFIQIIP